MCRPCASRSSIALFIRPLISIACFQTRILSFPKIDRSAKKSPTITFLRVEWEHMEYGGCFGEKLIAKTTPRVIPLPSQHVIVLQTAEERKWLLVSADFCGAGTRDESPKNVCVGG